MQVFLYSRRKITYLNHQSVRSCRHRRCLYPLQTTIYNIWSQRCLRISCQIMIYQRLYFIFSSSVSQKKCQAIVIARLLFLLSSTSCKNFNVAHLSKSIIGINTKIGMLAHREKMQLQNMEHNSESYISGVMPLF